MKQFDEETYLELMMTDAYAGQDIIGYVESYGNQALNPCTIVINGYRVAPVIRGEYAHYVMIGGFFLFGVVLRKAPVMDVAYVFYNTRDLTERVYSFNKWLFPTLKSAERVWGSFIREWASRRFTRFFK